MIIREDGTVVKRTVEDAEEMGIRALRAVFGEAYDTRDGNPITDLMKAFGVLGVVTQEDEMEAAYWGNTLAFARGPRLDALVRLIGGGERSPATASTGVVDLQLKIALAAPSPLFRVGEVYFIDGSGQEFDLAEDVLPNSTLLVQAEVTSRGTGSQQNIGIHDIIGVRFPGGTTVENFWVANVADFSNESVFTGGAERQTDGEYRAQAEAEDASNRSGNPVGIERALEELGGATMARVYENVTDEAGREDTVLASGPSTSTSQIINAAGGAGVTTRIAVKKVITTEKDRRWLQHFAAHFVHETGVPAMRVRIEGDTAGSPSGFLLKPRYDLTGWAPGNDVVTQGSFASGAYPGTTLPITAWLVFEATAGSLRLKGGVAGVNGNVKAYTDAAWANATINQAAVTLYGGIPPGRLRAVTLGGTPATLAQVIEDWRPAGVGLDGSSSASAIREDENVSVAYEQATEVFLTVAITVETNASFTGNANTIKDVLIGYVGGTKTTGEVIRGLRIGKPFVLNAARAPFFDPAVIAGVTNVTVLQVARSGGVLASPEKLTPATAEKFKLAPANITVIITG